MLLIFSLLFCLIFDCQAKFINQVSTHDLMQINSAKKTDSTAFFKDLKPNWKYFALKKQADSLYLLHENEKAFLKYKELVKYPESTSKDFYRFAKVCYALNKNKLFKKNLKQSNHAGILYTDSSTVPLDTFLSINNNVIKKYRQQLLFKISELKQQIKYPDIYDSLIIRKDNDQLFRKLCDSTISDCESNWIKQKEIDHDNQLWLSKMVDKLGWLGYKEVGEDGDNASWLIVQHADENVDFQNKMLAVLLDNFKKANTKSSNIAYLVDRILINEGKKQIFGTQFNITTIDGEIKLSPKPLENEFLLNTLRDYFGLSTLETYLQYAKQHFDEQRKK